MINIILVFTSFLVHNLFPCTLFLDLSQLLPLLTASHFLFLLLEHKFPLVTDDERFPFFFFLIHVLVIS